MLQKYYLQCWTVHPFSRGSSSDIEVMVGNNNLSREFPSELADVKKISIHEKYVTGGRPFDVALLEVWLRLIIRILT